MLVGPQAHLQAEDREKPIPGTFLELISSGIRRAALLSREQVCPGKGHRSDAVPHSSKRGVSPEPGGRWKTRKPPKATYLGLNYSSCVRKGDG